MKLSDGLSVLYITATGYFCAYCFQLGIFYHYGIPTELINVTIQNMSSFCFFLISILSLFIGPLLDNPISIEFRKLKPITKLALLYLTGILFVTLCSYLFSIEASMLRVLSIFLCFLPVISRDFLFPIMFRNGLSILEAINRDYNQNMSKPRLTFLKEQQSYYALLAHRCVILSVASLIVGGLYTVLHKNTTLCNQQQVLATSGDNVIIKEKNIFKLVSNSQCDFSKKE